MPGDSVLTLIVYSDDNVTNALFVQTDRSAYPATEFGGVVADTVPFSMYASQDAPPLQTEAITGSCVGVGGFSYPFVQLVRYCQAATFSGGVSFSVPVTSGPLADYQTVTIATQQFTGVYVKVPY